MPTQLPRFWIVLLAIVCFSLFLLLAIVASFPVRVGAQDYTITPCSTQIFEAAPSFMPPDVTQAQSGDVRGTPSRTPSPTQHDTPCPTVANPPNGFDFPQAGSGLRAEYFDSTNLTNRVKLQLQTNTTVNMQVFCPSVPVAELAHANAYSIRWTGQVEAVSTGYHYFITYSDDGTRLWLNGELLINHWNVHAEARIESRPIYLVSGQKYDIRLEYYQAQCDGAIMRLAWMYAGQSEQIIPASRLYATTSPDTVGVYRFIDNAPPILDQGVFYLRNSNTTGIADYEIHLNYAAAEDIPVVGDWNGDSMDSVGLYRPSEMRFLLDDNDLPTGQAFESPSVIIAPAPEYNFTILYGGSGPYLPIVGRWSSGVTTAGQVPDRLGLYDPTNGNFVFRTTVNGVATPAGPIITTPTGATPSASDKAVFGDWAANTYTYMGIYRQSSGLWYLAGVSTFVYGNPSDIAVVGDWDGDFDDGVGIYRNTNAAFHLKYVASGGAADISFTYGNVGDQFPLAGRWAFPPPLATPTASSQICSSANSVNDVSSINNAVRFRIQPSLDNDNWLFQIPNGSLGQAVTSIQNKSWLWPYGVGIPGSLFITSIDLVARVGAIGWVDPDIVWYKVKVQTTSSGPLSNIEGYLQANTTGGALTLNLACTSPTGLPTPGPEANLLQAGLATFAAVPPQAWVFDSQSPSTMGNCRVHIGAATPPCSADPSGSTVDVVPRNIELCIDSKIPSRLRECDPGFATPTDPNLNPSPTLIPVYSPREGCAIVSDSANLAISVEIRIDNATSQAACDENVANGNRFIVLSHIIPDSNLSAGQRKHITAGSLIGYLCTYSDADDVCENYVDIFGVTAPVHLAFQLRVFTGTGNAQSPTDIVGYLARQGCLYDDWHSVNSLGTPQKQATADAVRACP